MKRRYPLGDKGLAIVLAALFLGSWAAQLIFQVFVENESWSAFWASTMENWQSEYLQLLSFVVLTAFLVFKGSHESRDSDDELTAKIDEILERLRAQSDSESWDSDDDIHNKIDRILTHLEGP
jgi:hypothetical protein